MSVHALFRMANALLPIRAQEAAAPPPPAPPLLSPQPVIPPPSQPFRPSHALYSQITGRHEQLRKYRGTSLSTGEVHANDRR